MKFSRSKLAENMRVQRAKLDCSQAQLAEMAGISVATVQQYEDGSMTPGADKVFVLADALGCTPNELLGWEK